MGNHVLSLTAVFDAELLAGLGDDLLKCGDDSFGLRWDRAAAGHKRLVTLDQRFQVVWELVGVDPQGADLRQPGRKRQLLRVIRPVPKHEVADLKPCSRRGHVRAFYLDVIERVLPRAHDRSATTPVLIFSNSLRHHQRRRGLPVRVHPGGCQQTHTELAALVTELRVRVHGDPAAEVQDQPTVEQVRGRDAMSASTDLVFTAATA